MLRKPIWIEGTSCTGKTNNLIAKYSAWLQKDISGIKKVKPEKIVLVLAANEENRRQLAQQLVQSNPTIYPLNCQTTLGFIAEEVKLFWPLLSEHLPIQAAFPLRLRPETEQDLASKLWLSELNQLSWQSSTVNLSRWIRNLLDLLQLAGAAGIAIEEIPQILLQWQFFPGGLSNQNFSWQMMGDLLIRWRDWCWQKGLLSYGIIYELYWRYLFPDLKYQQYLENRYQGIFADDVDDYPAIAYDIFSFFLDREAYCVFTYNPHGKVRLGLGADPSYVKTLANRCQIQAIPASDELREQIVNLVQDPSYIVDIPPQIQSIQTISRAEMLRKTAQVIIDAVEKKLVKPEEIAIIAPGLDEIGRYTLKQILRARQIRVQPLNEQRPLISSPLIRALLSFLALVYPDLGRLVDRDAVAEMLVILSQKPQGKLGKLTPLIDPVRAGLIVDACYAVDPEKPTLLPVASAFPRWDRLGYQATTAYENILQWLAKVKSWQEEESYQLNPALILESTMREFMLERGNLTSDQMLALRELMETAQHYWEVQERLLGNRLQGKYLISAVAEFIQLLREGTITANPRPNSFLGYSPSGVTLATIFQYRSLRQSHRWHFWLDTGSVLWEKGGAAILFAAPLFLRNSNSFIDEEELNQQRVERILRDLLARVREKLYLCHSDLGINGREQTGPLLSLVQATQEV